MPSFSVTHLLRIPPILIHQDIRSVYIFGDSFTSNNLRTASVGCNSNSDVYDSLTRVDENGDPVQLSCNVFASEFDDWITNDPNWDETNPDFNLLDNLDARQMDCPNFANWGCFSANYTEGEFSNTAVLAGFNKGLVTRRSSADGFTSKS